MNSQDKNWAFRILPGSFDGSVRWLGCLSAMDRGVRTRIRPAAQPPLAFSRSAAVAFAYRPGHRVRFSVNDWRRRFAAPGHGIACDAPRHGRLVYYSVFVTSGFALIWRGSRSDQRILCRNRCVARAKACLIGGHSHGHPAGSPDRPFWQRRSEERGSARIAVHRRSGATTRRTIHSCRLPSHPSSCCRKCVTEPIRGQAR